MFAQQRFREVSAFRQAKITGCRLSIVGMCALENHCEEGPVAPNKKALHCQQCDLLWVMSCSVEDSRMM